MLRSTAGAVSVMGAQSWASVVKSIARAVSEIGARSCAPVMGPTVGAVCRTELKRGAMARRDCRDV